MNAARGGPVLLAAGNAVRVVALKRWDAHQGDLRSAEEHPSARDRDASAEARLSRRENGEVLTVKAAAYDFVVERIVERHPVEISVGVNEASRRFKTDMGAHYIETSRERNDGRLISRWPAAQISSNL